MAPSASLVAGLAILATGDTMSEFSRSIPSAGSFVTFIGRGIGARAPRTGQMLAGVSYYMLMICYPVTVGAVVVFMGSWVASLFGWGNVGWLLVTLGGVALALPLLLRGVVISARASFIMFCSEAFGLIVLSVVVLIRAHGHLGAPLHPAGGTPGGHVSFANRSERGNDARYLIDVLRAVRNAPNEPSLLKGLAISNTNILGGGFHPLRGLSAQWLTQIDGNREFRLAASLAEFSPSLKERRLLVGKIRHYIEPLEHEGSIGWVVPRAQTSRRPRQYGRTVHSKQILPPYSDVGRWRRFARGWRAFRSIR